MKLIAVYTAANGNVNAGKEILVWPDSALVKTGKPVFIPDGWERVMVGLGMKIHSVGKTIQPRFAARYFDEIAPVAFVMKTGVAECLDRNENPLACDIVADYSVVVGDSVAVASLSPEGPLKMSVNLKGLTGGEGKAPEKTEEMEIADFMNEISEAVSMASLRNTLKTGDMVVLLRAGSLPINPDTLLTVAVDGTKLLETKLK